VPSAYHAELDVLRGTAIVFVVYLHSYFSSWDVTPARDVLAMHVIHFFAHTAVPVFFFVSAFLLARDRSPSFGNFARRKLLRVCVPLLFWMAAALLYHVWHDGNGLTPGLVNGFLLFDVSGQFYYVLVLLVFYSAFFFVRGWSARWLSWLAAAAFVVNLATIAWYESTDVTGTFATLSFRNPLAWVFFYAFGLWAGRAWPSFAAARRLLLPALGVMAALFAVYLVRGEMFDDYPQSYFDVPVFLNSCAALVVYAGLANLLLGSHFGRLAARAPRALAPYAFGVYLVHMPFFIGYITNRWVSPSAVQDDWFNLMNTIFVVGFVTSLGAVVVVSRLWPWFGRELLGVEARRAGVEGGRNGILGTWPRKRSSRPSAGAQASPGSSTTSTPGSNATPSSGPSTPKTSPPAAPS